MAGWAALAGVRAAGRAAGRLTVITRCGRNIGINWRTNLTRPPPLRRRFAGSSVIEAARMGVDCAVTELPYCPRAPRNAPVPPTIAKLPCVIDNGPPAGGEPAAGP